MEAAPTALNVSYAPSPAAPATSWFGPPIESTEEDEDELAPQTPQSAAIDGEAGAGALPLAAVSWPASWVSTADNDD
jgi:hypothetical protein